MTIRQVSPGKYAGTLSDAAGPVTGGGCTELGAVKAATKAGTTCGGCVPLVTELLKDELRRAGVEVDDHHPGPRVGEDVGDRRADA